MSPNLLQHVLAFLAAVITMVVSTYQARRALAKAEHERMTLKATNPNLAESLRQSPRTSGAFTWSKDPYKEFAEAKRREPSRDDVDGLTKKAIEVQGAIDRFNVDHFRRIARLWYFIVLAAFLGSAAEGIDGISALIESRG